MKTKHPKLFEVHSVLVLSSSIPHPFCSLTHQARLIIRNSFISHRNSFIYIYINRYCDLRKALLYIKSKSFSIQFQLIYIYTAKLILLFFLKKLTTINNNMRSIRNQRPRDIRGVFNIAVKNVFLKYLFLNVLK